MKSVLFLIPTLDRGGAENVLVNLVNHMDQSRFRITVQTLFDKDSQKDRLRSGIEYKSFLYKQFHGNSRLQALLPARMLYRMIVGKKYDIVVSYLEGPTTHVLSGCPYADSKRVAWVHVEMDSERQMSVGFRTKKEALKTYLAVDRVVFVANTVRQKFEKVSQTVFERGSVLYNTVDSHEIRENAAADTEGVRFDDAEFNIVSVGRLVQAKGFDRLARVQKRLMNAGFSTHVYILGAGAEENRLREYAEANGLKDTFTLLGFQNNPYKFVAKADLFVCSSRREGFSTAVTESLILGTPVVSVNCSGARELLGENNEYGIVTENSEEALYQGIKQVLSDPALLAHYREKAAERGEAFDTEQTVKAVENMLSEVGKD